MGGWGGLHSDFRVKPNRCVVLCWGWGFDNNNNNDKNENPHLDFSKRMLLSAQNQSTRAMAKQGVKFVN